MPAADKDTFSALFDKIQADMITRYINPKPGAPVDPSKKAFAENVKRVFGVMDTQLKGAGGVDGLMEMLDNQAALRRFNIDPILAGNVRSMMADHAQSPLTPQEMAARMGQAVRQNYEAHVAMSRGAAPPPPGTERSRPAQPPAARPQQDDTGQQQARREEAPRQEQSAQRTNTAGAAGTAGAGHDDHAARMRDARLREAEARAAAAEARAFEANVNAQRAAAAGGAGGGHEPPADPTEGGRYRSAGTPAAPPSRAGRLFKIGAATLAALGIGYATVSHFFNDEAGKIKPADLQARTYSTAAEMKKANGPIRIAVEQALGLTLQGNVEKLGRNIEQKTGLTQMQFFQLKQALKSDDVKAGFYGGYIQNGRGDVTFAQAADGKFAVVKPGQEKDYANNLKVTVGMTKAQMSMAVSSPGQPEKEVVYNNAPAVQSQFILDEKERNAAFSKAWTDAEAKTAAQAASKAASGGVEVPANIRGSVPSAAPSVEAPVPAPVQQMTPSRLNKGPMV